MRAAPPETPPVGVRSTLRLLRAAPAFSVNEVADAVSIPASTIVRCTRDLPARGVCAQHAAAAAAAAHPACPSGVVRLAGMSADSGAVPAADRRSTTSWSSRRALAVLTIDDALGIVIESPPWPTHPALARLAARSDYSGLLSTVCCAIRDDSMPSAAVVRYAELAVQGQNYFLLNHHVTDAASCPPAALAALSCLVAPPRMMPNGYEDTHAAEAAANAAGHRNCPSQVVLAFAANGGSGCRRAAATNPVSPQPALNIVLRGDDSNETRDAARSIPPNVRRVVASRPDISLSTLEIFAEDPDATVRLSVARRSRSAASVLRRLAADTDPKVRDAAAGALKHRGL